MSGPLPTLDHHTDAGHPWPMHVWRFTAPRRVISSAPLGGGIGVRHWAINATVNRDYRRDDPDQHLAQLAAGHGLVGSGVGMLTAVDVTDVVWGADSGVAAMATIGLGQPTWAAASADQAPAAAARQAPVGTINVGVWLPVLLSDAALVNAIATATEAKAQALWECGVKATGTCTDALFVVCDTSGGPVEPYGGPRSTWGARLARAVHAAVAEGTRHWLAATG